MAGLQILESDINSKEGDMGIQIEKGGGSDILAKNDKRRS